MQNRFEQDLDRLIDSREVSRRSFIRSAAIGTVGAAVTLSGAGSSLAMAKDSGEVTLDALLITYFGSPLGASGTAAHTFRTPYTLTLGFRSLANPDISLRAVISPEQERINGRAAVRQARSGMVEHGIKLFPRPHENESLTIRTGNPGIPESTVFYGLYRPVLKFKGNGKKAQFRFVDASGAFSWTARNLRDLLGEETASSLIRQYVFDRSALVEPRYILVHVTGSGGFALKQVAEQDAPKDITSTVTARIVEQTGFESDILKQAFAVGSNLEITYYSAQESTGKILNVDANLERTSGLNYFYWDRVFKTFVIAE